jgi:hypothetical protein
MFGWQPRLLGVSCLPWRSYPSVRAPTLATSLEARSMLGAC